MGNVTYGACQWGMLIAVAKLGSPRDVGTFALALAITAPVVALSSLNLRSLLATDTRTEYAFADYLGLRRLCAIAFVLVMLATAFAYKGAAGWVLLAVTATRSSELLADIYYGVFQLHERLDFIGRSMMLRGVLSLAALAAVLALTANLAWGAAAMAVASLMVLLAYDARSARRVLAESAPADERASRWRAPPALLWATLPLGLTLMLLTLHANLPRYFLERIRGEHALGLFAAAASLQVAGLMIVGALGQAAVPRFARIHTSGGRRAFAKFALSLTAAGLLVGLCGLALAALFGEPLLAYLFGPEYSNLEGRATLVWVMGAGAFAYPASILGYAMTAARRLWVQVPIFLATSAVAAVVSLLLIPNQGTIGASKALAAAAVVQLLASAFVVYSVAQSLSSPAFGADALRPTRKVDAPPNQRLHFRLRFRD